jgi:hypothetical protein
LDQRNADPDESTVLIMVSKAKKSAVKPPKADDLDLDPDAWPKFEKMIRTVAKSGPQHKSDPVKAVKKPSKN